MNSGSGRREAEAPPAQRPPWWRSYVAPKRYIWLAIIFGVVLGGTIATAVGAPQWIGAPVGAVFASAVDLIWRHQMPPSEDTVWRRRPPR